MAMTTIPNSRHKRSVEQGAGKRGPQVVLAVRAVLNETQKSLWQLWGHRSIVLTEFITMAAVYPLLQFIIGNGTIERALVPPTLLAFLTYPILFVATSKLVGDLLEEVHSGTFEQMHLSPFSPTWLLVGRLTALVLEGVLISVIVAFGMTASLGVSIPLRAAGLLPALLTIIDIIGFALLIGGLALRLPQIGAIVHLFSGLIFALNGTLIPVGLYPGWVQTVARFLPTTLGIEATRRVVLEGQSLGAVWAQGTLPWLVAHAAGLAALGWVAFLTSDRRAMRRGIVR